MADSEPGAPGDGLTLSTPGLVPYTEPGGVRGCGLWNLVGDIKSGLICTVEDGIEQRGRRV